MFRQEINEIYHKFDIEEILWDEIAFPTVKKTLEYYIEDSKKGAFIFREEGIKFW